MDIVNNCYSASAAGTAYADFIANELTIGKPVGNIAFANLTCIGPNTPVIISGLPELKNFSSHFTGETA